MFWPLVLVALLACSNRDGPSAPKVAAPSSLSITLVPQIAHRIAVVDAAVAERAGVFFTLGADGTLNAARRYLRRDPSRLIYADLFRRTGAIVLSSSRADESSYEDSGLESGLFTEAVVDALSSDAADLNRDGAVDTDELRVFVRQRVVSMSGGAQTPTVDRDNIATRIRLGLPVKPRADGIEALVGRWRAVNAAGRIELDIEGDGSFRTTHFFAVGRCVEVGTKWMERHPNAIVPAMEARLYSRHRRQCEGAPAAAESGSGFEYVISLDSNRLVLRGEVAEVTHTRR